MLRHFNRNYNVLISFAWICFFIVILQTFAFFITMMSGLAGTLAASGQTLEALKLKPTFMLSNSLIWAGLVFIFLKLALQSNNYRTMKTQLALYRVPAKTLFVSITAALIMYVLEVAILQFNAIEISPAITEVMAQVKTNMDWFYLIVSVGLITPVIEEVVFRGIAFEKIAQTAAGPAGAIVIPSVVFTVMHSQYSETILFILLFIQSCFFGVIRYLAGSLWCSIVAHSLMNLCAILLWEHFIT